MKNHIQSMVYYHIVSDVLRNSQYSIISHFIYIDLTRAQEQTASHALSKPVFYLLNLLYFHKGLVLIFHLKSRKITRKYVLRIANCGSRISQPTARLKEWKKTLPMSGVEQYAWVSNCAEYSVKMFRETKSSELT